MWSPGNVTFHPMRDYAEWKNLLPSAANFETWIHRGFVCLPQKLCFCGKKEALVENVKLFRQEKRAKRPCADAPRIP